MSELEQNITLKRAQIRAQQWATALFCALCILVPVFGRSDELSNFYCSAATLMWLSLAVGSLEAWHLLTWRLRRTPR